MSRNRCTDSIDSLAETADSRYQPKKNEFFKNDIKKKYVETLTISKYDKIYKPKKTTILVN